MADVEAREAGREQSRERSKVRAVFMGTPAFAVPCLAALCEVAEVVLVVSQPDRPKGRGLALEPTPTKALALERGLPVAQPEKARDGALHKALLEARADVAVVVAYGKILPPDVLSVPRLGCLNVHASLLPRWRGAAPIQWSVIEGDRETGVCLMQMDAGMDTGPVLARRVVAIDENETAGELSARLATLSHAFLVEQLPRAFAGLLAPEAQPSVGVTHARMLVKEDGALDFSEPAQRVHDRVRGLSPWPGAFTALSRRRLKVHATRRLESTGMHGQPGMVLGVSEAGIVVACGQGTVALSELQLEGKKRMSAGQLLAGFSVVAGQCFAPRSELLASGHGGEA